MDKQVETAAGAAERYPIPHLGMSFREFVFLTAALMAVNAGSIDLMLPALPEIGTTFAIANANSRQWVISAYLFGFGFAQLFYGTVSDRFGRRPVLLVTLVIYSICSVAATFAPSFEFLLIARVFQGLAAAASRVVTVSVIRDCYSGRQMARVMSLAMIVFMTMPILAPNLGQLVMLVAPWRWIFGALALFGVILTAWVALRLPETLAPEDKLPFQLDRIFAAFRTVLANRVTVGYILALSLMMGAMFGFLNSAQQVFADVFDLPRWFTLIFSAAAGSVAVASFINSRIVVRIGMRPVSHVALVGFAVFSALNLLTALSGHQTVWSFSVLQCATMFCFGLTIGNFGAMAMEPVGHIAGTASSIQGFLSVIIGASIGFAIGHYFNGTTIPMLLGFTFLSLAAIAVVWMAEGRLFHPHAAVKPPPR